MSKPTDSFEWATDTNQATGPDAGTPTKLEPVSGFKIQGWISELPYLGQYMNWLFYVIGQWTVYHNKLEAVGLKADTATGLAITAGNAQRIINYGVTMPATIPADTTLDVSTPGSGYIEVQDDGTYEVHCSIQVSNVTVAQDYTFSIYIDVASTGIQTTITSTGTDLDWMGHMSGIIECTALQVVEVRVVAAANATVTTSPGFTFWMRRID